MAELANPCLAVLPGWQKIATRRDGSEERPSHRDSRCFVVPILLRPRRPSVRRFVAKDRVLNVTALCAVFMSTHTHNEENKSEPRVITILLAY